MDCCWRAKSGPGCLRLPRPRPIPAPLRIGLVLSGGGARGMAHVGVLEVLDDLHLHLDAIAGTSMGAVVGGLYASGMSAREIETLLNSAEWQEAFRDRPPRDDLSFRRKEEDRDFLVNLPLGIQGRELLIPNGAGAGAEAHAAAAPGHPAGGRRRRFRPAADALSRRRHRPGDRREPW